MIDHDIGGYRLVDPDVEIIPDTLIKRTDHNSISGDSGYVSVRLTEVALCKSG